MNGSKIKLNLTKLDFVAIQKKKDKSGKEIDCLIIPIEKNNLFYSEKGNVFLDCVIWENNEDKKEMFGDYQIKQSVSKEIAQEWKAQDPPKYPASLGRFDVRGATANETAPEIMEPDGDNLPF